MTANIPGLEPLIDDVASASSEVEARAARRTHISRRRLYLRRFLRNRRAVVGLAVLALLILFAVQAKSGRAVKVALGEADVHVDVATADV